MKFSRIKKFNWRLKRYMFVLRVKRKATTAKHLYWRGYRATTEFRYSPSVRERIEEQRRQSNGIKAQNKHASAMDAFKSDFAGIFYHLSLFAFDCTVAVRVDHGDQAVEALKWFRNHDYRSKSFKDDPRAGVREYYLNARVRDSDYGTDIVLKVYFTGEACKFVETGEVEHHDEFVIKAYDTPTLELQCEGVAIPTEV